MFVYVSGNMHFGPKLKSVSLLKGLKYSIVVWLIFRCPPPATSTEPEVT
jgi:hypothetical protein